MDTRYVQHRMSNDGPTYCVVSEEDARWKVQDVHGYLLVLPKSEYGLCDPPGRWVNVTDACRVSDNATIAHGERVILCWKMDGYRVKKARTQARSAVLIVEHFQP